MDIGKRDCKACIRSSDGSIAEAIKYNNTLHEAEIFAYSIVKKYGKCVVVCASREIRKDRSQRTVLLTRQEYMEVLPISTEGNI